MDPKHYRETIALSAPIAGIQFAQIALTTTDLVMMGLLGVQAVAAGGLALLLYNQFRTMCVGMVTALGNLVALSAGRSEDASQEADANEALGEEVRDLVRSALCLGTFAALAGGGMLIALGGLLEYFGQDGEVAVMAQPVMIALAPGLLPMVWLNVLRQFAVGMRRPGSLFWVTLASIFVNALLGAIFIFGWLGLPRLGLMGVGVATTLVQLWTCVVYWRMLRRDPALRQLLSLSFWRARRSTVVRIARLGWPISLSYGLEASIASIAAVAIGTFGPIALAASNVVQQLTKIVYQINVGLSHGSSILVSRAWGRREFDDIRQIAIGAFVICAVPMAVIGLVYLIFPHAVLWPFLRSSSDPATLRTAATLLGFGVAYQFLAAGQNICVGLLRGLGNTRSGLVHTFIGYWLVGIPAIFLFSRLLNLQVAGVWLGLCAAFATTSVLLWRQFSMELDRLRTEA